MGTPPSGLGGIPQPDLGPHRDRRYGKLSGGQQQRLSIALALIGRPRNAVLDMILVDGDPLADITILPTRSAPGEHQPQDRGSTRGA